MYRPLFFVTGLSLALGACTLAPVYHPPLVETPATYKEIGPWRPAEPSDGLARGPWWRLFNDATLDQLELQVDQANPTLAAAVARYDEARAFAARAAAGRYPQVSAGGSLSTNKQSTNRPLRGAASPTYYGANELDTEASYEIDLWGKIRNQATAGVTTAQASAAGLAAARLSLEAELASDYFSLRGLDDDAQLLTQTVDAYQKARDLTQRLFDGKIVGSIDVSRAETQLELARAEVSDLAAKRALLEHAIATLVGKPASAFSLAPDTAPFTLPDIPTGLPSALLQRRPDIAQAERTMKAANAQIGVARAAFYPSISLDVLAGTQSTNLNLLDAANGFWSLGPNVSLPIFNGGALNAQESAAFAAFRETSASYRATVLGAFGEVEDNLALLHHLRTESTAEEAAVVAAQHTLDVAFNLYHQGADSYLEVVTAQTPLLQAQQGALDLKTRQMLAAVGLIRALGGSWDRSDLPSASAAAQLAPNTLTANHPD
jgi:NodT family efflux transporter outer membrane factor (OMF) lipoprotein